MPMPIVHRKISLLKYFQKYEKLSSATAEATTLITSLFFCL